MATSRAQQIGIWTIAIVLTIGTIASFVAIVIGNDNQQNQAVREQEQQEELMRQLQEQYVASLEPMDGYSASAFDADAVTELKVDVLVEGTGEVLEPTDTINAHYFGWLSNGELFDSTNKKDADDEPATFSLAQVIEGWTEGLSGQKVGSVVELTIPADKAYGTQGSGSIPANSPLKFIVKIDSITEATE
jgi:FKBP-type peptidyl-prolyl cis-trans isomerase FkpA